ncbi:MAG: hypothetical protein ABIG80_02005 [Patescibacteria group bacterium]
MTEEQKVTADPELKEVRERLQGSDYAQAASFEQDPRKKEDFRFLPLRYKVEYQALKTDEERNRYLNTTVIEQTSKNSEGKPVTIRIPALQYIEQSRRNAVGHYERMDSYYKVPKVTPGLKTPELVADTRVYAMGGALMTDVAKRFPGKPDVMANSGNPTEALGAFESFIKGKSPDELKGSTVIIAFDPEMFGSPSIAKYMNDTETLLKRIKEAGMVAVMADPLNIGDFEFNNVPPYIAPGQSKEAPIYSAHESVGYRRAKRWWDAYRNLLGTLYRQGYMGALIGLGNATSARNTIGIHENFLKVPKKPGKGYSDACNQLAMNGFVAGVNLAHGKRTLDEELLPVERSVNADTEIYYYGKGKSLPQAPDSAQAALPTTELLPSFPCITDILDERVKHGLWEIGSIPAALELGQIHYALAKTESRIRDVQEEIDRAEQEGLDMKFARLEFNRAISEIYFVYAWIAFRKYKGERPGKASKEEVLSAIEYAEKMDRKYHFHPRFAEQVKKLRNTL